MPNCKLCNKALDAETADALCENCRTMKENLQKEQMEREKTLKNNRSGNLFLLGFLVLFLLLYVVITGTKDWKSTTRAEQLVIETVQAESGYTPFVSGKVAFTSPINKIVLVNYGITKESLKAEDCPCYFVSVSGKNAELMPLENNSHE